MSNGTKQGAEPKKVNKWIEYIKKIRLENPNLTQKEAILEAQKTYKPQNKTGNNISGKKLLKPDLIKIIEEYNLNNPTNKIKTFKSKSKKDLQNIVEKIQPTEPPVETQPSKPRAGEPTGNNISGKKLLKPDLIKIIEEYNLNNPTNKIKTFKSKSKKDLQDIVEKISSEDRKRVEQEKKNQDDDGVEESKTDPVSKKKIYSQAEFTTAPTNLQGAKPKSDVEEVINKVKKIVKKVNRDVGSTTEPRAGETREAEQENLPEFILPANIKQYKKYQLVEIINQYNEETENPIKAFKSKKKEDIIQLIKKNRINFQSYEIPSKNPVEKIPREVLKKYGVKAYNPEEQTKYLEDLNNNPKYKNPYVALKTYTNKQALVEETKIMEHQKAFMKQFIYSNLRGCIVFHGVGSGKTLTAVVSSYLYLKTYPQNKVIVISPAGLLYNFLNGMEQYGLDIQDNRYSFTTYDKYIRKPTPADNTLLIIDEAHNFRTEIKKRPIYDPTTNELIGEEPSSNMKGYKLMKYGTLRAHKVILLSGTVFVNQIYDIENLLAMIDQRDPLNHSTFTTNILNIPTNISDYFDYKISYYPPTKSEYFPEMIEKNTVLFMDEEQQEEYNEYKIEGRPNSESLHPNSFYSAERYASNMIKPSPKVEWIINKIADTPDQKFIVYSALMEAGINQIKRGLEKLNISYTEISGSKSASAKEDAKNYFNKYNFNNQDFFDLEKIDPLQRKYVNDNYRVMIITRAGAEGVDTQNCNNIILLDTQWNDAITEQIIARAIRYKSHYQLPIEDRYVNVYRLFLCDERDKKIVDTLFNEDGMSNKNIDWNGLRQSIKASTIELGKLDKINQGEYIPLVKELKELRIYRENKETKLLEIDTGVNNDLELFYIDTRNIKDPFSRLTWNYYKTLDTDEERVKWRRGMYSNWFDYYGKYLQKEKEQKDTISNNIPRTVDINMYIMAKSKTKDIEDFIKLFGNRIQLFEIYQSKLLPRVIEAETKKGEPLTEEEQVNIYINLLRQEKIEVIRKLQTIQTTAESGRSNEQKPKTDGLDGKSLETKTLQQYYTNPELARRMINTATYSNRTIKNVKILEPTAGEGNIVKAILEGIPNTFNYTIDMVELDPKNRIILTELVKTATNILNLKETFNFLLYTPSVRYDYIFMNPPFHIKKGTNNILYGDIWDYEFVKRAYSMLDIGGQVVAILSNNYTFSQKADTFRTWLSKDKDEDDEDKTKIYTELRLPKEKFGTIRLDVMLLHITKLKDDNDETDDDILGIRYYKELNNPVEEDQLNIKKIKENIVVEKKINKETLNSIELNIEQKRQQEMKEDQDTNILETKSDTRIQTGKGMKNEIKPNDTLTIPYYDKYNDNGVFNQLNPNNPLTIRHYNTYKEYGVFSGLPPNFSL